MKQLQQKLIANFTDGFVGKSIAAAVSGGVDSVAMLLLLSHYCRMRKIRLCVFHVDHSLRDSSENDRCWVENLAAKLSLEFFWRKAPEGSLDKGRPRSEAWAREFRYQCFAQMLVQSGAEVVATGHTADDQTETMVMRMLRGCSLQGLGGIRARTMRQKNPAGLRLWRPLLNIHRHELEQYLRLNQQDWREDESNSTDGYFRNRVRHNVVPVLKEHGSNVGAHLAALADDIVSLQDFLRRQAKHYVRHYARTADLRLKKVFSGSLRREIIRQWLIQLNLDDAITRSMILRVDDLWLTNSSGRTVDYRKFRFVREKGRIICLQDEQL